MANVYSSRRKVNRDKSIMILRFFSLPGGILTVPDQVSDEELVLDPSHLTWSKNYTEKTNIGLVTGDKTVDHNTQVFFLAKPCSPLTMPSVIAPLQPLVAHNHWVLRRLLSICLQDFKSVSMASIISYAVEQSRPLLTHQYYIKGASCGETKVVWSTFFWYRILQKFPIIQQKVP